MPPLASPPLPRLGEPTVYYCTELRGSDGGVGVGVGVGQRWRLRRWGDDRVETESSLRCNGTSSLLLHLAALSQFALCDFEQ